ncbi:cytoskeleton protein RodZ [Leminorella grimontii]|uniref:Cytoskeleton protein RodZ n=1 Tax=Leminorella grimontii TaxID=82981 RepID=A0AAV5N0V4_9GAMM|nr:putative membrane protein [Leminorella grimontii ATCC 33999 = DSM 5078]GKX55145.1 cytoskeleton protein RodZ [Leminorella grimontii]GKX58570.1 cytoskeleton protein RodZ [Leminorella grimontii]
MNLSQQVVADELRLKVTTVRELEEGLNPLGLAPTFIRGYVRSYAKLLQLPEEEILALLPKGVQGKSDSLASNRVKGFSLSKPRKKLDRWLTLFTWLIIFVVLGLTGAWWWENHKAQQQDDAIEVSGQNQIALPGSGSSSPSVPSEGASISLSPSGNAANAPAAAQQAPVQSTPASTPTPAAPTLEQAVAAQVAEAEAAKNQTQGQLAPQTPQDGNDIYLTFSADCWLEVIDDRGKNLYSGLQRKDGKLSLTGQPPYQLKLGAPAGVSITYKGKPVDMSQYKNANRTTRMTLPAN